MPLVRHNGVDISFLSHCMSRRLFIGDVHGHYDGLMQLVAIISPTKEDTLHFVGDLIDRGPKSFQVVKYVREQGYVHAYWATTSICCSMPFLMTIRT